VHSLQGKARQFPMAPRGQCRALRQQFENGNQTARKTEEARLMASTVRVRAIRLESGDIVRKKSEAGFFVVVNPGPGDVFIVPLRRREDGGYARLPSEKGQYAKITDLERDFTAAVAEARSEDEA
jgi:hypothetical protein